MVPSEALQPLALTTLAVRWLHVLAAAVAVGGSVLTWFRFHLAAAGDGEDSEGDDNHDDSDDSGVRDSLLLARGYEWLFWAAVGVLVTTGIGNLGAFAPTLPGGAWRTTLDVKLGLLTLVLVGSAVRTRLVVGYRAQLSARLLGWGYGATAVGLVALLTLAEVLAHG